MIVHRESEPGKGGGTLALRPLGDPRLEAFVELLDAIDGHSVPAMRTATRALKTLGFSVCVVSPAKPGGGAA